MNYENNSHQLHDGFPQDDYEKDNGKESILNTKDSEEDPYVDLFHEYEDEPLRSEAFNTFRKEKSNPFQAFLEQREKKLQQAKFATNSQLYPRPKSSDSSKNNSVDDHHYFKSFSQHKPSKGLDDSFIAESESFLEEMNNLQQMTLDVKTVDKRKSTVSKLNDDLRRKTTHKVAPSEAPTGSFQQHVNNMDFSSQTFKALNNFNQEEPFYETSFKKQLEARIRARNDAHRLWRKGSREEESQTKNYFKPDDLRKIIAASVKKPEKEDNTPKAFCLAGLLDEVGEKSNPQQKLNSSSGSKRFSKSMLHNSKVTTSLDLSKSSKNSSTDGGSNSRSSSAKKVRFNPEANPQQSNQRSKSLTKKEGQTENTSKKVSTSNSVVTSASKSTSLSNAKQAPQQQPQKGSLRELLAQRKGVSLDNYVVKQPPSSSAARTSSSSLTKAIASHDVQRPHTTPTFSTSVQQSFKPETITISLKDSIKTLEQASSKHNVKKIEEDSPNNDNSDKVTKSNTRFELGSFYNEEDEDDFFEARRLMHRISMLRNFIGGNSSKINDH
ncbi:hypothetical protein FDP41_000532 [Naegleria fowleri]|uniref:Uncharacterized protein n=1 Tax=Naegleria fowleri TaxID=5763 RepID=A0A6A5C2H5_NAEFO|nr:uncharacterized protein FDP41_000532 [Naegleria fowleri]KAF0984633.1 hypothetical protein FDP41_000532 [Naegleria fowleri]